LLSHPFFARPAPKSLDRQDFAHALKLVASLSPADGAATLAAFTARAAMAAPWPAAPLRVLVTGGGRRNPAIMAALRAATPRPVDPVEALGWDGDALEAQCFAYLAARVIRGLPLSIPGTTGVPRPLSGGRVTRSDGGSSRDGVLRTTGGGAPHPAFL
jgi:anhydro-N-acetylmuramic acid kinase